MMGFLSPIEVSEETLGIDAIAETPPGGHFFGSPHTMARYETAFYQPLLSDWRNSQAWEEAGGQSATERATAIWQQVLSEYEEPGMNPACREALDAYIRLRREEIGDGDP